MTLRDTVFATLAYADVFDYPLTEQELEKWIIKSSKLKVKSSKLKKIQGVNSLDGRLFLEGRRRIVAIRKQREKWAKRKMRIAAQAANILKFIPTIKLVGVTGALAMQNTRRDDDIDFYVVAAAGTLWSARFLTTIILEILGLRRKPGDVSFCNKICLNMYVDESHMVVPRREQDLFTAHEVLQMIPLWESGGTYWRFLKANRWVKSFLPNAWIAKCQVINDKWSIKKSKKIFSIWHLALSIIEFPVRAIQLWYMNKRRSTEVVNDSLIRFHPVDAREWIRSKLAARLVRHKIPLDKIFYGR